MRRTCGILLHITSLPSPYGIGTLGQAAFDFIDFLVEAGQSCWQLLPTGPTGYGNSPYQVYSTFAGNHNFIDLDLLVRQGLLTTSEVEATSWGQRPDQVDFDTLERERLPLFRLAYQRFRNDPPADFARFCEAEADWLEDYALFMALRVRFKGKPWTEWPDPIRLRKPRSVTRYRQTQADEIGFHQFLQYQFHIQWEAVQTYAHERGIQLVGDLPIYVSMDSADVWCHPEQFQLDAALHPTCLAGCPPDQFSEDGQFWGNPIYDWNRMEQDGFQWWMSRIAAAGRLFDVIRIDHFRGLESYWAIPAEAETAKEGAWIKGPGKALIDAIRSQFPHLQFIAEDLGFLTKSVCDLLDYSGYPGMKVLEFGFDSGMGNDYLPHNYQSDNCVCYTGTHDNTTLVQWCQETDAETLAFARDYLKLSPEADLADALLQCGLTSQAGLFIAPLQDYLKLGAETRMNEPGTLKPENWRWRCTAGQLSPALSKQLWTLAHESERLPSQSDD